MAQELHNQQHGGRGSSDRTGAIAGQVATTAQQVGRDVQQRASSAINAASETGGRVAENAGEVLGNFRSAIENSARSQPTTTVMLATLAGFLFGALWNMRSRY